MDLKSPGIQGVYVDFVQDELEYLGKEEIGSYYKRQKLHSEECGTRK